MTIIPQLAASNYLHRFHSVPVLSRTLGTKKKSKHFKNYRKKLDTENRRKSKEEISSEVMAWNNTQIAKLTDRRKRLINVTSIVEAVTSHTNLVEKPPVLVGLDSSCTPFPKVASHAKIPKGTVVYHGTNVTNLHSMINDGHLKAKLPSNESCLYPPRVFVSGPFKALHYASRSTRLSCLKAGFFTKLYNLISGAPLVAGHAPVLIELELPEDTDFMIDPDYFACDKEQMHKFMKAMKTETLKKNFLLDLLSDDQLAKYSWSCFHSASLPQDVPVGWIRNLYFPQLLPECSELSEDSLNLFVAAKVLERSYHISPSEIEHWLHQFDESPLLTLSVEEFISGGLSNMGGSFDAVTFTNDVYNKTEDEVRSLSKYYRHKLRQSRGDNNLLESLIIRDCHNRTGSTEAIQERMLLIRDKYLH